MLDISAKISEPTEQVSFSSAGLANVSQAVPSGHFRPGQPGAELHKMPLCIAHNFLAEKMQIQNRFVPN